MSHNGTQVLKWDSPRLFEGNVQSNDVCQRQTRYVDNSKLYLPTGNHLTVFTDHFQYAADAIWNKLPVHIREAENTPAFKSTYIKCIFNLSTNVFK